MTAATVNTSSHLTVCSLNNLLFINITLQIKPQYQRLAKFACVTKPFKRNAPRTHQTQERERHSSITAAHVAGANCVASRATAKRTCKQMPGNCFRVAELSGTNCFSELQLSRSNL